MKKSSYLKVAGVCLCATLAIAVPNMFNTARAIDSPVEKIEGILGAEIGDVKEQDVQDIVDVVDTVLKVGVPPHTIPANCPENIKNEINTLVNLNASGRDLTGSVDSYETILYGNGKFIVYMVLSLGTQKYTMSGTKINGEIRLESMSTVLDIIGNINNTDVGDIGMDPDADDFVDDYEPSTGYFNDDGVFVNYDDLDDENKTDRPSDDDFDIKGAGGEDE